MKALPAIAAICIALCQPLAHAQAVREVRWADLLPTTAPFEDPFEKLTAEQKLDLRMVATVRQMREKSDSPLTPDQMKLHDAAVERLGRQHVDIDGLLGRRAEISEKRRRVMEAVNEKLNGQTVRIPGYVLPLEMDGTKVTEFLLVPYVGACIHAPTPPPNQIVHVKHSKGFEVKAAFAPVWVEGEIRTEQVDSRLTLVDGAAEVRTAYAFDAAVVKPFSP